MAQHCKSRSRASGAAHACTRSSLPFFALQPCHGTYFALSAILIFYASSSGSTISSATLLLFLSIASHFGFMDIFCSLVLCRDSRSVRCSVRCPAFTEKSKDALQSVDLFFGCWALFPILFFSLSQSKLPGYILPAIPPLFLLLGNWISRAMDLKPKVVGRVLGWSGGVLLLIAIPLAAIVVRGTYKLSAPGYFRPRSSF